MILTAGVPEYEFSPESPPSIIGELITGVSGYIEVWEGSQLVAVSSSGCAEIGTTGKFAWSTSNIPVLQHGRQQFHWQMSGGGETDDGDFVLRIYPTVNLMPSLNDTEQYLHDPRT